MGENRGSALDVYKRQVKLGVFVDEALSFIDSHLIPLDAVAVSCGPGSYTCLLYTSKTLMVRRLVMAIRSLSSRGNKR